MPRTKKHPVSPAAGAVCGSDVEIVSPPPAAATAAVGPDDDDGKGESVTTLSSNLTNATVDYPHARYECGMHAFVAVQPSRALVRHGSCGGINREALEKNHVHCAKCHCYVCDVPSGECARWSTGASPHCMATNSSEYWVGEKERGKRKRARQEGENITIDADTDPAADHPPHPRFECGVRPLPTPRRSPRVKKQKSEDPKEILDRCIEGEIKPACPVQWFASGPGCCQGLTQSMDEEAELCLTLGWKSYPGDGGILKKCLEYLDPEGKGAYPGGYLESFDRKAAEKALREDEVIRDVYKFTSDGEGDAACYWDVCFERKKKLTKTKATEMLKSLFNGEFCRYPAGYDNFGRTAFSQRGDSDNDGDDDDDDDDNGSDDNDNGDDEQHTSLSCIKEYTFSILERSKSVAHAFWEGSADTDVDSLVEREDFLFFRTNGGQEFLLKFRSKYECA